MYQHAARLFNHQIIWRNNVATIHGRRRSPEYISWRSMIQRCTNPNAAIGARRIADKHRQTAGPVEAEIILVWGAVQCQTVFGPRFRAN
jgi:hypothetical protein